MKNENNQGLHQIITHDSMDFMDGSNGSSVNSPSFSRRDFLAGAGVVALSSYAPFIIAQGSNFRRIPVQPNMTVNQVVGYISTQAGIDLGSQITDDSKRLVTVEFGPNSPQVVHVGINAERVYASDQIKWATTEQGVSMFKYRSSKKRTPSKIDYIFPGDSLIIDLTKLSPDERAKLEKKFPQADINIPIKGLEEWTTQHFASTVAREREAYAKLGMSKERLSRYQNMTDLEFMTRKVNSHIGSCMYSGFISQGVVFMSAFEATRTRSSTTHTREEARTDRREQRQQIEIGPQIGRHTARGDIREGTVRFGYSWRDAEKPINLDYRIVPNEGDPYNKYDLRNIAITPYLNEKGQVYEVRIEAPLSRVRTELQSVMGESAGERAFRDMVAKTQTRENRVYAGIREISLYFGRHRPDRPHLYGDERHAHALYTKLRPLATVVNTVTEQVVAQEEISRREIFRDFSNPRYRFEQIMLQAVKPV